MIGFETYAAHTRAERKYLLLRIARRNGDLDLGSRCGDLIASALGISVIGEQVRPAIDNDSGTTVFEGARANASARRLR